MTVIALLVLTLGGLAAAQEPGRSLDDLLAVGQAGGVVVMLAGDGPFSGQMFTLDNPPRVVLDLPGVVSRVSKRVHEVEQAGVHRVRVAQFQVDPRPITRVVVDLDHSLPYRLEETAQGAILRVGEDSTAAVAEVASPGLPAVEPEAVASAAASEPAAVATGVAAGDAVTPAAAGDATAEATGAAAPAGSAPGAKDVTGEVGETPSAEPVRVADRPPAAASPVQIVDEPPATAPAIVPAASMPSAPAALTAPPGGTGAVQQQAQVDAPWTTTAPAVTPQASPATPVAGIQSSATEVESEEKRFTGEPISLELKDADIRDVLRTFAKITGLNVVVDPDVKGSVTVNLENVPWDQCLDIILRINGLDYTVENNVLRVARTATLTREKQARAEYNKQFEATKPMRTVTKTLSYAKAGDAKGVLTSQGFILSDRGSIGVDERTNTLIIRDTADRIEGILALVDQLDTPNPQVMIEARIVETTRTFSHALGVSWGFTSLGDAEHGTTTGWKFPYSYSVGGNVDLIEPGNGILSMTFGDILDSFNLDFTLAAAESNGLAKIVSSPKIIAENNTPANIQSGIMIPIQTVANNTVTVQYVNATLSLNVTPQITAEGTVLLKINIQKREPLAGINLQSGNNAPISTRDAQTSVMVRDGGTTVIGGIYQLNDNTNKNSVPGLSKIPIIGGLFRNTSVSNKHDELLIFITPRIVKY